MKQDIFLKSQEKGHYLRQNNSSIYIFLPYLFFSWLFYKISKEGQRIDEVDFFVNLNINQIVTESVNKNIDIKSQLEHKVQSQETKIREWILDKIISRRTIFQNW